MHSITIEAPQHDNPRDPPHHYLLHIGSTLQCCCSSQKNLAVTVECPALVDHDAVCLQRFVYGVTNPAHLSRRCCNVDGLNPIIRTFPFRITTFPVIHIWNGKRWVFTWKGLRTRYSVSKVVLRMVIMMHVAEMSKDSTYNKSFGVICLDIPSILA